jgi:uncharacterized protein YecE (DUF72 family)
MEQWPYVFESPDGGQTIYIRKHGETERKLYHVSNEALENMNDLKETQLWHEIRQYAKHDEELQKALERVKIIYYLKKHGNLQS